MRPLSPEETALWQRVAATIKPLSRDKADRQALQSRAPSEEARLPLSRKQTPTRPRLPVSPLSRAPGTTLDGSWDRRLGSGAVDPDRTVDLHGLSLDGAWQAIDRSLEQAIARGDRVMLLITGHHRAGDAPLRRGAIRSAVHDWLAASRHAPDIAAVRGAHRRHGGAGSLYIVLRRKDRRR